MRVPQALAEYDRCYHSRTKGRPPPVVLTGERPELAPSHYTIEEELLSRIWSYVYGLRAELIAAGRVKDAREEEQHGEDATEQQQAVEAGGSQTAEAGVA